MESGSFYAGADGVLLLDPPFSRAVPDAKRSRGERCGLPARSPGAAGEPCCLFLPSSHAGAAVGPEKRELVCGAPGERRSRKRGPNAGRRGARAAGRPPLPSPSHGPSYSDSPAKTNTLLGCRGGGPHAVVGPRAECGAAQSGPRCSWALQQVYLRQNSVLVLALVLYGHSVHSEAY